METFGLITCLPLVGVERTTARVDRRAKIFSMKILKSGNFWACHLATTCRGKAKGGFPAFEARKWNYTTFLILPTVFTKIVPLFAYFLLREILGKRAGKIFRVHPLRFWLKIALLIGGVMNGDVLGAGKRGSGEEKKSVKFSI